MRENFRVILDGNPYVGGDELEVAHGDTLQTWLTAEWVEPVAQQKGKS